MKTNLKSLVGTKTLLAIILGTLTGSTFAQNLDSLYEAGEKEMRRRHYNRAQEIFNYVLEKDPKHAGASFSRGLLFYREHKYDESLEDYTNLSKIEGDLQDDAYYWMGQILGSHKDDCKTAVEYYDKAIALNSEYTDAYLSRAECKIELMDYDGTISDAENVLAVNEKNYTAHYYKGKANLELGNIQTAIEDFTKAIELRPRYADPYFSRGTAYLMQAFDKDESHKHQSLTSALENYDAFIDLNKTSPAAYFDRGEVKMELHDYKGAIADFSKAISLDPDDYDAHTMKAICNYHYGYTEQALKEFDAITRMNPEYVNAHFNKGIVLIDLARYEEAIEEFDQVVKKDPEHSDGYEKRGEAKFEAGMIDEACEDFNKAAEMGDEEAAYWVQHNCGKHKKKYKKKNKKTEEEG